MRGFWVCAWISISRHTFISAIAFCRLFRLVFHFELCELVLSCSKGTRLTLRDWRTDSLPPVRLENWNIPVLYRSSNRIFGSGSYARICPFHSFETLASQVSGSCCKHWNNCGFCELYCSADWRSTAFLRWAKEHSVNNYFDGLGMLIEQAAESYYIWRGFRPDTQPVFKLLRP